ncbi:pirin-like C-terminal cupin domain-containing protein [Bradyrhizobium sp.]|nr:pirin-like C-terminal cupin domain-containing protein [Bradyrhizobium sp.]
MVPIEPFTLLDVELRRHLTFDHPQGHVTLIYVATGDLAVSSEGGARHLAQRQAIAMHGDGARLSFAADELAHLVVMSAPEIREPVLIDGPFIMSSAEQIAAARVRYRSGGMGQLPPS